MVNIPVLTAADITPPEDPDLPPLTPLLDFSSAKGVWLLFLACLCACAWSCLRLCAVCVWCVRACVHLVPLLSTDVLHRDSLASVLLNKCMLFVAAPSSLKASEAGLWEVDDDVPACRVCSTSFGLLTRRHHCRVSCIVS